MRRLLAFILALAIAGPALALTASQRLVLLSGCPNGASVSLNFAAGQYCGGSLASVVALSRASSGLAQDTSGTWYSFGSNVPRITNQGFLIEPARTNKSTNFNASPAALVAMGSMSAFNAAVVVGVTASGGSAGTLYGVVDKSAAISAAGLGGVANGRALKIDNSAGTASAYFDIGGATNDTNGHTISAYLAADAGAPGIYLRADQTDLVTTSSSSFVRISRANITPDSSADIMHLKCPAGTVGYLILNDLEEGASITSPIVIAGASATRAADAATILRTGIGRFVFTFSDGTTQTVSGLNPASQYTIPTNLNKPVIARMTGYPQ